MKKVLKYQIYHLAVYIFLTVILYRFSFKIDSQGKVLGASALTWIYLSWIFAGIHQVWILFFWRLELYYKKISNTLGRKGFLIFKIGFVTFIFSRFIPIIPISLLTRNTLKLNYYMKTIIIIGTTPFILWTAFSVIFYFGINRTFGADHFFVEYRSKNLEKRGIYKYIKNSMYAILILIVYHPGLFYGSAFGLIFALFQHLMVWTHYFCTEKPDLKMIYGRS